MQRLCVFVLTTIAWVFFRAYSVSAAVGILRRTLSRGGFDLALSGMDSWDWYLSLAGMGIILAVSLLQEHGFDPDRLRRRTWTRWALYLGLMAAIVVFGMYGPGYSAGSFIYEGF